MDREARGPGGARAEDGEELSADEVPGGGLVWFARRDFRPIRNPRIPATCCRRRDRDGARASRNRGRRRGALGPGDASDDRFIRLRRVRAPGGGRLRIAWVAWGHGCLGIGRWDHGLRLPLFLPGPGSGNPGPVAKVVQQPGSGRRTAENASHFTSASGAGMIGSLSGGHPADDTFSSCRLPGSPQPGKKQKTSRGGAAR